MYLPGGGLVRLQELIASLSDSEARVAKYILDNPGEFVGLTLQEVSRRSGGSPAAVVRLWKSLGFEGFNDLKFRVASDIQSRGAGGYTELKRGGSFGDILHSVQESHVVSIENTFRLLKEYDVQEVADALVKAGKTLAFGGGASGVIALDFAQKLLRIGLPVHCPADFHTAAVTAAHLGRDDVMVAVSYSGRTTDLVEVAKIAAANGARVVAITRFGDTPISRAASICLHISSVEPEIRLAATASRISALAVIDALFIYLANQHYESVYEALELTRGAVRTHKLG